MTLDEMKARKKELGYSNAKLSELSGVPLGTVIKIFGGSTHSPRRTTITALEAVLKPKTVYPTDQAAPSLLRESSPAFHTVPKYTLTDYYRLPDDVRTELIDGVFYDMAAPSWNHQAVIGEILAQIRDCLRKHKCACRAVAAPCDVQLDMDPYTMLQPDILVVCDLQKIRSGICYGAPDLTIEVLSPTSRSHDMILKLNKYKAAGVREYWIVDPENKKVLVYRFEDKNLFMTYDFTDKVPVGISDGLCTINFNEVEQMMLPQNF